MMAATAGALRLRAVFLRAVFLLAVFFALLRTTFLRVDLRAFDFAFDFVLRAAFLRAGALRAFLDAVLRLVALFFRLIAIFSSCFYKERELNQIRPNLEIDLLFAAGQSRVSHLPYIFNIQFFNYLNKFIQKTHFILVRPMPL